MATNEFLANNVVFQYRDATTVDPWKTLVCETSITGNMTVNVNSVSTKCGVIKSVGEAGVTVSGSGVANTAPTATQGSLKDILDLCKNNTLMDGRLVNLSAGSVALGAAVLIRGDGYFTAVSPNADADQSLTFDWTFEMTGTIDTEESDES